MENLHETGDRDLVMESSQSLSSAKEIGGLGDLGVP